MLLILVTMMLSARLSEAASAWTFGVLIAMAGSFLVAGTYMKYDRLQKKKKRGANFIDDIKNYSLNKPMTAQYRRLQDVDRQAGDGHHINEDCRSAGAINNSIPLQIVRE